MRNIKELAPEELKILLKEWGFPQFHAQQIFSWIYKKGVAELALMSNLPEQLKMRLNENFTFSDLKLVKTLTAHDKTQKFLFQLKDRELIEAVVIPAENRVTACISTQAGCKFRCLFCASGFLGFKRNLTCAEILEEILYLKNNSLDKKITHLVFMGMGEPLDNYEQVIKAIRIINSSDALNIGARRITVSTCGIIPGIKRLSQEGLQIELSISLHAADDRTRSQLMPVNKIYPLLKLIAACKEYVQLTKRQLTFEYVMIAGANSGLQSALRLGKLLKEVKLAKVNLIPCNPVPALKISPPNKLEFLEFKDHLVKCGINVTLRRQRGADIEASCGQLRLGYEKA